jgi:hypothetical protein
MKTSPHRRARRRLHTLQRMLTTQTPTYDWTAHQRTLPRLPLPSLHNTLLRYLESVKPLQNASAHAATRAKVQDFLQKEGLSLHAELTERNRQATLTNDMATSYIRPFWNDMYLQGRYPLPINSNPYLIFPHDKARTTQEARAAHVVCGFAQFWLAKQEHRLPPDVHGCMDEYDRLFCATRLPQSGRDCWKSTPNSTHICVLHGANIYKVDVITEDGVIAEDLLQRILKEDILSVPPVSSLHHLGDLSTLDRDAWTEQRSNLTEKSNRTSASIDTIDDAMFVLGLDVEGSPDANDLASVALHGGHCNGTQEHRWYDKTCLIVNPQGHCAYNFEHSLYDGAAMRRLCDELWLMSTDQPTGRPVWGYKWSSKTRQHWKALHLDFDLDTSVQQSIEHAAIEHQKNQRNVHIVQGSFLDYGKNVMKSFQTSPDGVLQAMYKLVHARIHGWTPNKGIYVYESCQTKNFLCGRTEVIRTTTQESNQFVDYMMAQETQGTAVDCKKAVALLRASAKKHTQVARLASQAQGVDRHLFAMLRIAMLRHKTTGVSIPDIFLDNAWSLSNSSILSTSNLSSEAFHGMGFGPVVPQGYGIAYGINREGLYFGISNFASSGAVDVDVDGRTEKDGGGRTTSGFGGVVAGGAQETTKNKVDTNSALFKEELFKALRELRVIFRKAEEDKKSDE